MKFEIFKNNKIYMTTHSVKCIPSKKSLDVMQRGGFQFRIDGHVMNKFEICKYVDNIYNTDSAIDTSSNTVENSKSVESYVEQNKIVDQPNCTVSKSIISKKRVTRKIRCLQNGETYNSMSAAGRSLNIDPASISYAMQNCKATSQGYEFEFVDEV